MTLGDRYFQGLSRDFRVSFLSGVGLVQSEGGYFQRGMAWLFSDSLGDY